MYIYMWNLARWQDGLLNIFYESANFCYDGAIDRINYFLSLYIK